MIRWFALVTLALVLTACFQVPPPTVVPSVLPTAFPTAIPLPPTPWPSPTPALNPLPPRTSFATPPPATAPRPPTVRAVSPTLTLVAGPLDPGRWVRTLLVAPGQPGRLYALLTDRWSDTQPSEQMRFLISDDWGVTWKDFPGGLPTDPPCTRNVNLDYYTTDALYASTCKGLYRWKDNQWTLLSTQQTGMVAVVYGQPQNIWATNYGTRSDPVIASRDGGKTWQSSTYGLVHFIGLANLAVDPRDRRTLYGIIWPKYGGSYLRRAATQGQWGTMPTPLNNSQIDTGMTIDGATGALYVSVFVGGEGGGGRWEIWRTRQPTADLNAIVWEKVYDFGQAGWVTVLASGWSPQGLALYARITPDNGESYVQRSADGGKTWTTLAIR